MSNHTLLSTFPLVQSAQERHLSPSFGDLSQSKKLSEIRPPLAYIRTNLKRDHGVLDFRLADVEEDPAVDVSARVESKETL